MLLKMCVGLYTSRVVLSTLGVEDFGIYNVVGGTVVLFSFINNAMSTATQRFLSFELGRKDLSEVKRVFSMSLTVHICIAALVVILAEIIGLWFLNAKMNISPARMDAANWVYQFSIITTVIGIIKVPYRASIIAYEKMSFYAFIGIVEAVLKLLLAFSLVYSGFDKLKTFSVLTLSVSVCIFFCFRSFCRRKTGTGYYYYFRDKKLFVKLISFSGWSLFGSMANVSAGQGVNILLNIFHGVAVNAAKGVANQVNGAMYHFVSNFQTAFRPQIVKLYALGKKRQLEQLIFRSSKFSFLMLFCLNLPLMLNLDFVMKIWLKTVPEHANVFCLIIMLDSLLNALGAPFWMTVQATGKIKKYIVTASSITGLNIVLSYIVLKLGYSPPAVVLVKAAVDLMLFTVRLLFMRYFGIFKAVKYVKNVLWRIVATVAITLPLPLLLHTCYSEWKGLFITSFAFYTVLLPAGYFIGLNRQEKQLINDNLHTIFKSIHNG
jgi:O-antigen/teichoic acid export membrane protein